MTTIKPFCNAAKDAIGLWQSRLASTKRAWNDPLRLYFDSRTAEPLERILAQTEQVLEDADAGLAQDIRELFAFRI